MTTRETLIAARGLIDTPEKWCQDAYERDGRRCALAAVNQGWRGPEAYHALLIACGDDAKSIGEWNDAPERTHAEVMEAFDRAIEAAA